MKPGQRVKTPEGATGEVVYEASGQILVYLGTADGKRLERWFDKSDLEVPEIHSLPLPAGALAEHLGRTPDPPASLSATSPPEPQP